MKKMKGLDTSCFFFFCALLMVTTEAQNLRCMEGYTIEGPDSGKFEEVDCGTGTVYCEYKSSTVEDGYVLRCALTTTCENDEVDPLWEDVECCNDADLCNDAYTADVLWDKVLVLSLLIFIIF